MSRRPISVLVAAGSLSWALSTVAQIPPPSPTDAVRVTVSLNADGSRTIYQFDNAKHEAIATATEADGKPRCKIVYQIGDADRFGSGVFFRREEKFLFKMMYNYDDTVR